MLAFVAIKYQRRSKKKFTPAWILMPFVKDDNIKNSELQAF